MAESILNRTPACQRRGASPTVAFFVVALAALAVMGIAFARRDVVFESTVVLKVIAEPSDATVKFAVSDARAAVRDSFERSDPDAPKEAMPTDEDAAWIVGPTRNERFCVVAVRSTNAHRLAERLDAAARQFVDQRNAVAAERAERELTALRKQTTEHREESAAAAKRLVELERRTSDGPVEPASDFATAPHTPESIPKAAPSSQPQRTFDPRWVLLRDEVALLEGELAALRGRYTEQHPEIQHALVVLADRKAKWSATAQYVDGGGVDDATPIAPPLIAPQSDNVADARPDAIEPDEIEPDGPTTPSRAELADEVEAAKSTIAAANARLDNALAAEDAAARKLVKLAASGPWRHEVGTSIRAANGDAAESPWLPILATALAAGFVASLLARGIQRIIESPTDAVAALGVNVVGIVSTDTPPRPRGFDPGVAGARWLVRAAVAVLIAVAAVAYMAMSANDVDVKAVSRHPLTVLSLSRDWLAARFG